MQKRMWLLAVGVVLAGGVRAMDFRIRAEQPLIFNFGPESVQVPDGVVQTGSRRFVEAAGYGWVRVPSALRQRNKNDDVLFDTFAAATPADPQGGEFAVRLPNGTYVIEVAIGDMNFSATPLLFVQDETAPWIEQERIPAGQFVIERRAVAVTEGRLRVRFPGPATQGTPFSGLAYLKIFPEGTSLKVPAYPNRVVVRPLVRQADIPETPVAVVPGVMVERAALARSGSEPFQLSDPARPAMWCWYQDPRAVVDTANPDKPMLLAGAVTFGPVGSEQRGDIDLYWMDLSTVGTDALKRGRVELEDRLQMDDHAVPALMIRPDGRYLATWSLHGEHGSPSYKAGSGESRFMRWNVSVRPGDPTEWGEMRKGAATGGGLCYTHPAYLAEGNNGKPVTFNVTRSFGFDSHVLWSDDLGETWRYGGWLIDQPDPWPHDGNGGRAYVKTASDGRSRVYIVITDDHPHVDFNDARTAPGPYLNSVYAGYIEDNQLHRMDGTVVDENLSDRIGTPPTELTVLLKDGTEVGGVPMRRGWQSDIRVMPDGWPVTVFQFRANDDKDDHRYFYARFDGEKYNVHYLAHGGSHFGGDDQPDYAGLATVDPLNPEVVYISTSNHPVTGELLISSATGKRQFEIFMGRTLDQGRTWRWTPVTENSTADNIRPFAPAWRKGRSLVLWMQGDYPRFYVYNNKMLGQWFDL